MSLFLVHGKVISIQTLGGKVCQWHVTCWWFSLGTQISSTDIIKLLLKVALKIHYQDLWRGGTPKSLELCVRKVNIFLIYILNVYVVYKYTALFKNIKTFFSQLPFGHLHCIFVLPAPIFLVARVRHVVYSQLMKLVLNSMPSLYHMINSTFLDFFFVIHVYIAEFRRLEQ